MNDYAIASSLTLEDINKACDHFAIEVTSLFNSEPTF